MINFRIIKNIFLTSLGISVLSYLFYPRVRSTLESYLERDKKKNRQKELRYLDIPFLQDEETIKHAKISHFMFIMRGVSGSGKSTIVSELKSTYSDAVVCSADDFFFGENGVYTFDIKLLPVAHESCRNKARTACETKKNIVIIDNTNVKKWEMTDYVNMASNHGYVIIIIVPQTPWCFDPVELARKNQHGVPEEVLCKKIKMFEEVMPIYYGWILNQSDSISLTKTVSSYFSYCVDNLSEFKEVMKDKIRLEDDRSVIKFENIFTRPGPLLHCTSYFQGRSFDPLSQTYYKKADVVSSMNRYSTLTVVGFTITPRTVGAQVKLSKQQLLLWFKDDNELRHTVNTTQCLENGNTGCDDINSEPRKNREIGSRAHLTLGFSHGQSAVQTGFDQLEILDFVAAENEPVHKGFLNGTEIMYYGEGRVYVKLPSSLTFDTLFTGMYS